MLDYGGEPRPGRILVLFGPKGGVGKSTVTTNLVVAARLDGLDAVAVDLDSQGSTATWGEDRARIGHDPQVRVVTGQLPAWRKALAAVSRSELAIVDCPPGLAEGDLAGLRGLVRVSHLVLIPALAEGPSLRKLGDLGGTLHKQEGVPTLFVLNKTIPGRAVLGEARAYLKRRAELCPVELPMRDHIHRAMDAGTAVVEDARLGGSDAMRALWRCVGTRLGFAAPEAA